MIKIQRYNKLPATVKRQLDYYSDLEFGHIPIVKETAWASPDWTIINYFENEVASFYNIILREVSIDNLKLNVAGINNVLTPGKYRGKGYSTKTLKETETFIFDELKVDLGLLFCADDLVPFYQRLGWFMVDCPVYFDQPGGKKVWTVNTMLLTRGLVLTPEIIDLNGWPW